jgi:hypothetical protein
MLKLGWALARNPEKRGFLRTKNCPGKAVLHFV